MQMLGIDEVQNFAYEGVTKVGYRIIPAPILVAARVISVLEEDVGGEKNSDPRAIPLIFREDAFDPVARIRRGRFYRNDGSNPQQWRTFQLPANILTDGQLVTFRAHRLSVELQRFANDQVIIAMGDAERFTIWSVVSLETSLTGEEVVTLRSRETFGALPKLAPLNIPESSRDQVLKKTAELASEIHRAGPESIVDRAREAITAALSAHLQNRYGLQPGKDIGKLIAALESELKKNTAGANASELILGASHIVKRLHARGKNAEQENEERQLRAVTEQDAELAVSCVGAVLCDLQFAEWR